MVKIKKVISLFLFLSLLLCGCGSTPTKPTPETITASFMPFEEYVALVSEVVDSIYADCGLLSSIVRYQDSYWTSLEKLGGTVTQDKLISHASEWLEDESEGKYSFDMLISSYESISTKYKEIVFAEVDSPVDKIEEVFDEYFDARADYFPYRNRDILPV